MLNTMLYTMFYIVWYTMLACAIADVQSTCATVQLQRTVAHAHTLQQIKIRCLYHVICHVIYQDVIFHVIYQNVIYSAIYYDVIYNVIYHVI
jgi:hypothetical protein